jgi:hypothetical protein
VLWSTADMFVIVVLRLEQLLHLLYTCIELQPCFI